jgi:membrane-associated phospholipid phosphatase
VSFTRIDRKRVAMFAWVAISAFAPVTRRSFAQTPESHQAIQLTTDWLAPTLMLGGALIGDERIRPIMLANRSPALDHLASGADLIATAGHIVPALAATYIGARVIRDDQFASATLRVALSYLAADAIEATLKPVVGRARPYQGREPLTFRPLSANGDFQSFPSAHEVHIASLSTAVALEAKRPWVTALAAIAMTYVGAQRVYRDQHWTSDVVASGILGVDVARATEQWLHAREARRR